MAGIQFFDLGPPRVDTFNMLSNLGNSFFNSYDKAIARKENAFDKERERKAQDRKWALEDEDKKIWGDYAKSLGGSPADTPAQPSRAVSEVGTTTPSPRPPSFSQTGGQMRGVNTSGFTPALSSLIDEFKQTFPDVRITSGYRDPSYNAKVGGAKGSQHIHGNAFDFSVRGLPEERQLEIANWLRSKGAQGFGYYPNSQSMHADLGSPRAWGPSYGRDSLGQTPKWFQQFAGNAQPVEPPSGPPPVAGRSMVAYAGVPRTQVASAAPGLGYTPAPAPMPMPVPRPDAVTPATSFDEAVPGATTMASLGGMAGAPTMPLPAPQVAPVAAPAPPPAPAPVQVAQAAPAAPVAPAAPAGDPLQEAFRRLPPARQQWVARALQNSLTRPAVLAQLQSMVRQNEYTFTQTPDGGMARYNKATGVLERVPGFDKPQDRWTWESTPDGGMIGTNAATSDRKRISGPEATSLMKEYNFALSRGENPGGFMEFIQKNAELRRPQNIVNNMPGEKQKEIERGKDDVKRETTIIDAGEAADKMMVDLTQLRQLSTLIGNPGKRAEFVQAIGPWAAAVGVDIAGLSDLQAYDAIIKRIAPQQRVEGSGSTSDIEYKGMLSSLGNATLNPQAREIIYDTIESVARYNQARRDIVMRMRDREIDEKQMRVELKALGDPMSNFRKFKADNPQAFPRKPLPDGYTGARVLDEAKKALKAGRDRAGIEARLREFNIDPKRLDE